MPENNQQNLIRQHIPACTLGSYRHAAEGNWINAWRRKPASQMHSAGARFRTRGATASNLYSAAENLAAQPE